MKKLLLFMLGVLIALPAFARDFKYNYEGQTIIYTVIDEEAKTCKTKEGEFTSPGNKVKGKLVLPAHPNDGDKEYTLTKIGSYSFHDNDELTEIIIPNSVTEIGSDAFSHSSGLTEIIIPNSVTVIGNGAFGTCVNLTEVIIPNSVTKIGSRAFSTCCDLTEVIIPNSVTEFGEDVFWGCELSKLAYPNTIENPYGSKGIQYPAENAVIEDGIIYNSEKTKIYYATIKLEGEFTIPNSITEIGEKTFYYCSGLTEVIIPNSVTYIGEEAFYYCSGLTEVIIPNSVTYIGENAFQSSGLTEVIIPNSVTYIGEEAFRYCYNLKKSAFPNTISNPFFQGINVQYPAENAVVEDGIIYNSEKTKIYYASLKLEGELTIPNSVENIGENAFYGCSGLTKMTIPNSVTEIGEKAFRSCSGLYEVVAVSEVPAKIANSSFEGLYGSTTLSVPKGSVDYYLVTNWSMFKNLQEGDRAIKYTTYSDDILTYRLFPAADTSEQNKAIVIAGDYKSLTEVSIPERFTYSVDDTRYYVTAVGYGAFRDCEDLSSINFNNRNKATLIGDYAFANTGISTIELPSTIESIGNYAFKGCKNLNSINIPEKVRELGNSAFSECSSLSEISIPVSVEKIGNSAFANCYSLNSLTLNEGLEYIGNKAFNNCTSISEVSIPASVGQIGDGAFALCSNLNSVTLNEGLEYIGNEAFSSCSSLPEISIPASVNIIGENAFYNSGLAKVTTPSLENWSAIEFANEFSNPVSIAKGLWLKGHSDPITDLVIPEGVERVADYAFIHCESIMTISLPNTLQTIGDKAFACLSGINTLILPNSLEEIGLEAFYNCSSLSDITIGTSLKSCNSNHFTGCNLDRITIADGSDKLVIEGSWDNFSISDLYMGRQIEFK